MHADFWVGFTLQHLCAPPGARDDFIFKGGTSPSKVWRAIHPFSEDIENSLSREWLGFGGDRDPEAAGTRKQRAKQLAALSVACGERLREEIALALRQALTQVLVRAGRSLEVDPEDEQTLLFAYPTAFCEITGRAYILPLVKIECGARSDRWPVSSGQLAPYVAEAFTETLPNAGVDVPVLDIERTLWEKASILHPGAHRPADKSLPGRYSVMAKSDSAARALEPHGLQARVVAHKKVFFPAAWARIESARCYAPPGRFSLRLRSGARGRRRGTRCRRASRRR